MLESLWPELGWPLLRILLLVSAGLAIGNFIEAMNWTRYLAVSARPLIRLGRLSAVTGASFSLAFFSGVSANAMLAEAHDQNRLAKKELVLANLFNTLPRFFLHLPTVFFLTLPFIKSAAVLYAGLTLAAALLQTMAVVLLGRLLLPPPVSAPAEPTEPAGTDWRQALRKSGERFRNRLPKLMKFMVPVYILFFLTSRQGWFAVMEETLAERAWFLAWLHPQSLSIVILHVTAGFPAGLAAAGGLLADASLGPREVVLALLAGNILAAPVRAFRHQMPYYMGIFPPGLAMQLIGYSQACRLVCLMLVASGYYVWSG